uniref:Retrovirus-related Pol polyprotein from transposon TNT 1-94 n=1 Tax=Vitis vinifera TaxID=29760 RepID=A5B309_VITVI|nr:hypothetical protein VITISV_003758 [Vitis vinifera]
MDLDYAIRTEQPLALTNDSTTEQMANFEKWEHSNHMSLIIMKHSILDTIRGAMSEEENAKSFLSQIADQFVGSEKVETSTILFKLVSMQYKDKGNIKEYIMEMSNLVTRLRALKLELCDDILVQLVLISLIAQFSPFKISYNTQKEKWTLNELIAQCVQEEERLKQEKIESAHLATISHDNARNMKMKRNNDYFCYGYLYLIHEKSQSLGVFNSIKLKLKINLERKFKSLNLTVVNFITGLHIVDGIERPLRINYDNKAVELYSKINRSSSKSKHINLKFLVVKERVKSFQVSIEHTSTNFMIADLLTKGVPPKVFHEHMARMGMVHLGDILM